MILKILGISAYYHDSAAALLIDGEILSAAQEERFTRKKHDFPFPLHAIRYCLESEGLFIKDLDAVVFYDKPFLKFERLLETYYGFAPLGFTSFLKAIPVWIKEKIFIKNNIIKGLQEIERVSRNNVRLLFTEHHLSHAASAFYPSAFQESAILTIDGVGEWATASLCYGNRENIKIIKELLFPHSVGLLYSSFTYYLGFRVNSGEYKLMGLAPYGNPGSDEVDHYIRLIKDNLVDIKPDGSIWLNQKYFTYATGLRMVPDKKWGKLFGFPRRKPEAELEQHHCDLAMAIQNVTEEIVLRMAEESKRITGSENICLAGGVALNCVANGNLLGSGMFKNIFIQPAAGDAGGAVGACLSAYYLYFGNKRRYPGFRDAMHGAYLGPSFSDKEIISVLKKYKASYKKWDTFPKLAQKAAELIDQGNVIGWFQGKMEFGPRALGNRSILGDASNEEMQKKLNLKIKYRESFRPFAPSVLQEDMKDFFDLKTESPYMLLVAQVKKERRANIPGNYYQMALLERLYTRRSDVPAVTHIDFSARVQSVDKQTNPRYWELLKAFKDRRGYGLLVNTSFNVRGEPIVCTPEDAYRCFMRTEMDYLILGDFLLKKSDQPEWNSDDDWEKDFILD